MVSLLRSGVQCLLQKGRSESAEGLLLHRFWETGLTQAFLSMIYFLVWMSPKACFTVNDRFCLWKICQGSCVPGIWSSRDCLMLMDFLEDFCGVPQAWDRLAVDAIRRPQSDFSRPLASEQFVSALSQASVSLTLEKVTPSLGLSQAACASPFSACPSLTVLVLGPLPECSPSSSLSSLAAGHTGTDSQILVQEKA